MDRSSVELPEPLNPSERGDAPSPRCPRCGDPPGTLPGRPASALGVRSLRRCTACGARFTDDGDAREPRFLFTCTSCGLPFLSDRLLPHREHLCGSCLDGEPPAELPGDALTAAMEREVRAALSGSWRFVASAPLSDYLDRLARLAASRIDAVPAAPEVVLDDADDVRTLALPSGTILLSRGALGSIEDEAELLFVLGHELAHAASGDAAVRLVRLGLDAAARERRENRNEAWTAAVLDLVRLGYGRRRERDADARAVEAMLALGYDTDAPARWLGRLRARIDAGDPRVADAALSHPTPEDRARRIERALYGRTHGGSPGRINREVFRRATARAVLGRDLAPVRLDGTQLEIAPSEIGLRRERGGPLWAVVVVAVLVSLFLAVGYWLTH